MGLTVRSVIGLAIAAASALVVPMGVALSLMVTIGVFTVVDAWRVRAVPDVERTAPAMLSRGVAGRLIVRPRGRWPRIDLKQPVADAHLHIDPPVATGALDGGILATRRGHHILPAVATRSVGPLGLGSWYHRTGEDGAVTVYPDLPAARRLAIDVRTGRFREEGKRSRGPLGLGTDLESIRDYQPDDDIRQVNWRATARVGSPMSNTYRLEQDRDVLCFVDCGRLMAAPTVDANGRRITRLDAAVDTVAAMAAVAGELGDHIGVVAFADRVLRSVSPRRDNEAAVLHAIHDLEPLLLDADYDLAFRLAAARKGAFVLVLTDLLDETAAGPLVQAIPSLGRRHSVTVASTADDAVQAALETPAENLRQLAETAVAADLLEARRVATTHLTHHGADVVVAPVADLSARCVGSYLRAKRRARF